jgi:hypothetical protein
MIFEDFNCKFSSVLETAMGEFKKLGLVLILD